MQIDTAQYNTSSTLLQNHPRHNTELSPPLSLQRQRRVAERSHRLDGHDLKVKVFMACLGQSAGGFGPSDFYIPDPVPVSIPNPLVRRFFRETVKVQRDWSKKFRPLHATLCFGSSAEDAIQVSCSLVKSQPQCQTLAAGWKDKVDAAVHRMLTSVGEGRVEVKPHSWEDVENHIKGKLSLNRETVILVPDKAKSIIHVVGLNDKLEKNIQKVSKAVANIEKKNMKKIKDTFHLESYQMSLLEKRGFFQKNMEEFKCNITPRKGSVLLEGASIDVQKVRSRMEDLLRKVISRQLTKLKKIQKKLLDKDSTGQAIDSSLKEQGVVAVWRKVDQNVDVHAFRKADAKKAEKTIFTHVSMKKCSLSPESTELLKTPQLQETLQRLQNKYPSDLIETKPTEQKILIAGFAAKKIKNDLEKYMLQNTIYLDRVRFSRSRQEIIRTVWKERLNTIQTGLKTYRVQISCEQSEQAISVTGTCQGLKEARIQLQELGQQILCHSQHLRQPDHITFFFSKQCESSLKLIISSSHCAISLQQEVSGLQVLESTRPATPEPEPEDQQEDEEDTEDENDHGSAKDRTSPTTAPENPGKAWKGRGPGVEEGPGEWEAEEEVRQPQEERKPVRERIGIMVADITGIRVDAIVNAANSQLEHGGGLAKYIVEKGGRSIQDESRDLMKKKGTELRVSEVVSTGPGELSCREIFHAVGPRYINGREGEADLLALTVKNCLQLACERSYRSIAIPAISTGIFRYPIEDASLVLLKAAKEFLETRPDCSLESVIFCDTSDHKVHYFLSAKEALFPRSLRRGDSGVWDSGVRAGAYPDRPAAAEVKGTSSLPDVHPPLQNIDPPQPTLRAPPQPKGVQAGTYPDRPAAAEVKGTPSLPDVHPPLQNIDPPQPTLRAPPQPNGVSASSPVQKTGSTVVQTNITVSIVKGEIAKQLMDVIVNSISQDRDLKKGKVSLSILQQAGPELQTEIRTNNPSHLNCGDVAITSAYGLQSRYVFHVVLLEWSGNSSLQILQQVVKTCLLEADQRSCRSIAFPALGTGILSYPVDQVAQTMLQAVSSFEQTHPMTALREVRVVVYSTDHSVFRAFHSARTLDRGSPAQSTPAPVPPAHLPHLLTPAPHLPPLPEESLDTDQEETPSKAYEVEGVRMVLKKGQKEAQLALAILVYGNLTPSQQGVYKNVEVVVADVTAHNGAWEKCLSQSLQIAAKKKCRTIALDCPPATAAVVLLPSESFAEVLFRALTSLKPDVRQELHKITVLFPDTRDIKLFMGTLQSLGDQYNKDNPVTETGGGWFPSKKRFEMYDVSQTYPDTVTVYIYATDQSHIHKFQEDFEDIVQKSFSSQTWTEDQLGKKRPQCIQMIKAAAERREVSITLDKATGAITLRGFKEDVLQSKLDINDILKMTMQEEHEEEKKEIYANFAQWSRLLVILDSGGLLRGKEDSGQGTRMQEYPKEQNSDIERAYQSEKKTVQFVSSGQCYMVDFNDMVESPADNTSHKVAVLRRLKVQDRQDIQLPSTWAAQAATENVKLVRLQSGTPEFNVVASNFYGTIGDNQLTIVEITRIQNQSQYRQYQVKRMEMETQNRDVAGVQNELLLWHGTAREATDNINRHGFNRSYCGKNAVVHGHGVYFAVHSEYSARDPYSPPDAEGKRYIYQSRVLVGVPCDSHKDMRFLPDRTADVKYDSSCNHLNNPSIYVIFNDTQAYPEYLITFMNA